MKEEIKKENNNLWSEFQSIENNSEGLVKKAKALAPILLAMIMSGTKNLIEVLENKKFIEGNVSKKEWDCCLEYICFFLSLIDRQVWSILGEEEFRKSEQTSGGIKKFDKEKANETLDIFKKKRGFFMDTLVSEVNEVLPSEMDLIPLYNTRQKEYGKYKKMFAEKDESPKGTLFWEFSKKITQILGYNRDIRIILVVFSDACSTAKEINLPRLLGTNLEKSTVKSNNHARKN